MSRDRSAITPWLAACILTLAAASERAHAATGRAQAPAEGLLDLREIAQWLPGAYDNEPQRFFLQGMKRGSDAPARRHVVVTPVAAGAADPERRAGTEPTASGQSQTFELTEHAGDERAPVVERRRWQLSIDPRTHFVRMTTVRAQQGASRDPGCAYVWRRTAGVFRAEPTGAGCPTLTLAAEELWFDDPAAPVAETLLKARRYVCFAAVRLADGKPHAVNGLIAHDRGGAVDLVTPEPTPRTLTLVLRRGLWPSNSGNNFVQLLNLYLYDDGRATLLGNGWATPESGRVGFASADSQGQRASARCKREDVADD